MFPCDAVQKCRNDSCPVVQTLRKWAVKTLGGLTGWAFTVAPFSLEAIKCIPCFPRRLVGSDMVYSYQFGVQSIAPAIGCVLTISRSLIPLRDVLHVRKDRRLGVQFAVENSASLPKHGSRVKTIIFAACRGRSSIRHHLQLWF